MAETRALHATSSAYSLPNDATEHERLDLQTRGLNEMMHGQIFHSPIRRQSRMLEVDTGTGYVTRHLASTFPEPEVIGLDLSQVPVGEKTNAVYVQGDIMDDIAVSGPFDFMFGRMIIYGVRDWPAYTARAWDLLSPGGWLEFQEVDASEVFDEND